MGLASDIPRRQNLQQAPTSFALEFFSFFLMTPEH